MNHDDTTSTTPEKEWENHRGTEDSEKHRAGLLFVCASVPVRVCPCASKAKNR